MITSITCRTRIVLVCFYFVFASSLLLFLEFPYHQDIAAQSQPLPPELNPFIPIGERGVGEIDSDNLEGDRLHVYISSPLGVGNINFFAVVDTPFDFMNEKPDLVVGKTFNMDARIAYTKGVTPDVGGFYTVMVPVLFYEGVLDGVNGFYDICYKVLAIRGDPICKGSIYTGDRFDPDEMSIDIQP